MEFLIGENKGELRNSKGKKVKREKLLGMIEDYIARHNVMGLAKENSHMRQHLDI